MGNGSNSKIMAKVNFANVEITDSAEVGVEMRTIVPLYRRGRDSAEAYVNRIIAETETKELAVIYMTTGPTTEVTVFDHRSSTLAALKVHMLTAGLAKGNKDKVTKSRKGLIEAICQTAKVVITQKGEGENTRVNINLYDPEFPKPNVKITPAITLSHSRKRPAKAIWKRCGMRCTVSLAKR